MEKSSATHFFPVPSPSFSVEPLSKQVLDRLSSKARGNNLLPHFFKIFHLLLSDLFIYEAVALWHTTVWRLVIVAEFKDSTFGYRTKSSIKKKKFSPCTSRQWHKPTVNGLCTERSIKKKKLTRLFLRLIIN